MKKLILITLLMTGSVTMNTFARHMSSSEHFLGPKPNHLIFNRLLARFVSEDGKVNYSLWKQGQQELDHYLTQLADHPPLEDWNRKEKLAYWINAYNAFTIKMVLDYYPVKSIRDIHNGNPWDHRWIKLGTEKYSLNQIENDILRPEFLDARIHFAINCAARSCPPLANQAFLPENVFQLLNERTTSFLSDPAQISISEQEVSLSRIFEWYEEDFGNILYFLNRYQATELSQEMRIVYRDYDWALNE